MSDAKRRGRPCTAGAARSARLVVRCTPEELARWHAWAAEHGGASGAVRAWLESQAGPCKKSGP